MNGKEKEMKCCIFCCSLLYVDRVVPAYNEQFDTKEMIRWWFFFCLIKSEILWVMILLKKILDLYKTPIRQNFNAYLWCNYIKKENRKRLIINYLRFSFVLEAGLEPAQPRWPRDFKSLVSTIPPFEQPYICNL